MSNVSPIFRQYIRNLWWILLYLLMLRMGKHIMLHSCITASLSRKVSSHSLSKACPPRGFQLQTAVLRPFPAPQPLTVAWTPVPKPRPGKTFLIWNSVTHLPPPLSPLPHLALNLAIRMHRSRPVLAQQTSYLLDKYIYSTFFVSPCSLY